MASWKSGDVEANGIRLHYTRTGGDRPPLVLAHGVTDDGPCWSPVATALMPDYDVIMVDARGHGQSDAPETGYDPTTQAADLLGVIQGLGLQKPAVLGHSMGAATTLVLAGRYPDVPRAILLEDPPGWWAVKDPVLGEAEEAAGTRASAVIHGRQPSDDERLLSMQAWFTGLKQKTREQLIAEQRAASPDWSEDELAPWADSKIRVSTQALKVLDPRAPRSVDWPTILRLITCPALLITADPARGAVLPADAASALQSLVPQLEIAHIPGAGHNIRREQFNRFISSVRSFLDRQAAS